MIQAQKIKVEEERKAYINPELSDAAREEGNTFFKVRRSQAGDPKLLSTAMTPLKPFLYFFDDVFRQATLRVL